MIARPGVRLPKDARRKFNDELCGECAGEAPGPDIMRALHHSAVPADEKDIDWKAHEKRVDRAARHDDEGMAGVQPIAAQQSAPAAAGIRRELDPVREDDARSRVPEPARAGLIEERRQKWRGARHATSCL